jgi:hypothetical protein
MVRFEKLPKSQQQERKSDDASLNAAAAKWQLSPQLVKQLYQDARQAQAEKTSGKGVDFQVIQASKSAETQGDVVEVLAPLVLPLNPASPAALAVVSVVVLEGSPYPNKKSQMKRAV